MTLSKFTNQPANEEIVTTINDIIDAMGSTTGANIDLSNLSQSGQAIIDGKVSKSGDTMTGDLSFNRSEISTLSPGEGIAKYIKIYDINDELTGELTAFSHSDGSYGNRIAAINQEYSTWATIEVGIDSNGNNYCTFPNTTCVDGQIKSYLVVIASNVSLINANNTSITYTLSTLPNDGFDYMVLIYANIDTGAETGNYGNVIVNSDICGDISICRVRTRTKSTMSASGAVWVPVSSSHKIYLHRASNWNAICTLTARNYRRIGTNS